MENTEYISKRYALKALEAIRLALWEIDIPSPTVPEYVEHHEQITDMLTIVDGWKEMVKDKQPADVVPVRRGKWIMQGKQMIVNLENAREQYAALGYPHRNEYRLQCSLCRKITMVDGGIVYKYCPHCGAEMKGKEER